MTPHAQTPQADSPQAQTPQAQSRPAQPVQAPTQDAPERARQHSVDLLVVGDTVAAGTAVETARDLGATVLRLPTAGLRFEGRAGGRFVAHAVTRDARGDELRREVIAAAVVLACGTEPALPPVTGLPDVRTFTTETLAAAVAKTGELPESLLVLGGGPTGCAQAQGFAARGSRVTVVEAAARLLPDEEPVASRAVTRALTDAGVRVLVGGTVTKVSPTLDGGVYAGTEMGGDVAATHLLLATGRRGATTGLALPGLGLLADASGRIVVDEALATQVPGIYAAGDLAGLGQGDHTDAATGRIAAVNAVHAARHAGRRLGLPLPRRTHPGQAPARWEVHAAPMIIETEPGIARIGPTLAEALAVAGPPGAAPVDGWSDVRAHDGAFGDAGSVRLVTALARGGVSGGARGGVKAGAPGGRRRARHDGRIVVGATLVGPTAREDVALLALAVRARVSVELLGDLALPVGTPGRSALELLADLPG